MHETKGDVTQIKKKMCSKCDHGAPCTMGGLRPWDSFFASECHLSETLAFLARATMALRASRTS